MKKTITLFTLLFTFYLNAQSFIDETSLTFGVGPYSSEKLDSFLTGNINLLFNSYDHLFGISLETGSEFSLYNSNPDRYFTANLLYGRNFAVKHNFSIELLSGLGYYSYKERNFTNDKYLHSLNLPFKANFLFHLNKGHWINKMGIGISSSINNKNIVNSFLFLSQFNL